MVFGTLSTLDDLQDNPQTVAQFGELDLAARVAQALAIHNAAMQEMITDFAIVTGRYQFPYGVADDMTMQELDQFGSPDVQKMTAGGALGLPLRFYGIAVQWNRHYILNASVGDLLGRLDSAAAADLRNVILQIRRALFKPTNTLGYSDVLDTRLPLDIHALLNADGMAIPPGPNGEVFAAGSHTHYLANATFTEAYLTSLVDTVVEHGVTGGIAIYIARGQEVAIRAFTGFSPYVDTRVRQSDTTSYAMGALDMTNPTDRAIGIFSGAEVSVKPWIAANYQTVFDRGAGTDKALAIRTRSGSLAGAGGFGTLYEADDFPLRARALGREFGVGVVVRHKAAVGYSGAATYTMPAGL
ncbi:MAG: hypothetical protein ACR2OU_04650 [Thermomicrobiales bacterium]